MASRPADQRLRTYRGKRDFTRTPEPAGEAAGPDRGRFVVQRHRARRLHYDFRLEVNGVLASWAVPKGPTLDPSVRRLAVHVEDHPIEYRDFEGVIPAGEYGGGDVIVWDRGTWTPVDTTDPARAIANGELHFDLDGEKLKGRFVLVRTGRPADGDKEQWILLHKRDEFAQPGWDPEAYPASVKSGRSNEETAADPDAMWDSNAPADRAEVRFRDSETSSASAVHNATSSEIRALNALAPDGSWSVAGTAVPLTDLDRVLWPGNDHDKTVTKRDLVRYYASAASSLLPYLVRRRVRVRRYPDGVEHGGHWRHQAIDDAVALVEAANDAGVELAVAPSLADKPDRPAWAFVDIVGSPSSSFAELVDVARLFRTALTHLGVAGCPKLNGEDGIEIWIPVGARHTWPATKAWVEQLCRTVGSIAADLEHGTGSGRPRMDISKNAPDHTLIAPFSPRPRPGAPVSVPITWDELDDKRLAPDRWTIRTIGRRLRQVGDPLHALIGLQQRLPPWS